MGLTLLLVELLRGGNLGEVALDALELGHDGMRGWVDALYLQVH
jgi:hypothetical protein